MSTPLKPHQYTIPELINLMKTEKVLEIQMGTLRVVLSPEALKPVLAPILDTSGDTGKDVQMPSDDEMLMWSSGYSPTEAREAE